MQGNRKLRVALLIDGFKVSKYVWDLLIWLQHQDNIVLSHLVIRPVSNPARFPTANTSLIRNKSFNIGRLSRVRSHRLFATILWFESLALRAYKAYPNHLKIYDIRKTAINTDVKWLNEDSGFADRCSQNEDSAQNMEVDVLIDCGSGGYPGDLPSRRPVDIIYPRYGNDTMPRQDLPGFWECYHAHDYTEFTIEKLSAECRRSEVIMSGTFPTQFSFLLNRAHLYAKAYEQLGNVIKTLAATGTLKPLPRQAKGYLTSPYTAPGWRHAMVYLCKISHRLVRKIGLRVLGIRQSWGISIIQENWAKAMYWRSSSLRPPRGRYWADPFLYKTGTKTFCFVEEFIFKKNRAHIAAFEVRNGRSAEPVPVLIEDFHLSFPFIFEYNGAPFMCPESSEAREVRVYRCVDLPVRWELAKVIMREISAADTMIFEKHGKWWMLTNIDKSSIGNYCSDLYLFYAESPLATNWTSHSQNPIKVDSLGGRNAGLIIEQDRIFRVGQRQGFDQYGKGISVYEIKLLNEDVYQETLVWDLDADFRDGLLGVHHLSSMKGITAIDHVQLRFAW
jgi:hypothetical protein